MEKLTAAQTWRLVHAERQTLIVDLADQPSDAYRTPSLCSEWTVHDVLAHLVESARTTRRGFVLQMLRARGDFDRANAHGIAREKRSDPYETLAAFRAAAPFTRTPPGGLGARLLEAYVHGEDIRRPLGITAEPDPVGVLAALRYVVATPASFGGAKERVRGLRLIPSDPSLSSPSDVVGDSDGAEVTGRTIDLLLAASGRPVPADSLSGPAATSLIRTT